MSKRIALLVLVVTSQMFASSIDFALPVNNPHAGDTFMVAVNVVGITDLYAFQFDVSFNPAVLSAISVGEGAFLPGGGTTVFVPGTIDNVGGTISGNADALIGAIPGVSGDGTLAEIQFTALAPGTSTLSFPNPILLDSSLNDVTASTVFQNSSVTVDASTSIPEPQPVSLLYIGILTLIVIRWRVGGGRVNPHIDQ